MRLSPIARSRFIECFDKLAHEQMTVNWDMAATWPKLRAYGARLALVLELTSWAEGDVEWGLPT